MSNASRPVAIAYCTVARTAARFGFHEEECDAAFPPKKYDKQPGFKLTSSA